MEREELGQYLDNNKCSCAICKDGNIILTSFDKGVAPLYKFIKANGVFTQGKIEIGDKIVGRAVAFLAIYLGATYIYTKLISETALRVLENYEIQVNYEKVVPYIYNRNRDGQCPMESALGNVRGPEEAYVVVDEFMKRRMK